MDSIPDPKPNPALIRAGIEAVHPAGGLIEVRILKVRKSNPLKWFGQTFNGFYDDLDALVRDVARVDGRTAPGVYMTFNELDPIVRNWGLNRLASSVKAAEDANVTRLRYMFLDLDPERPTFTNATEAEHAAAMQRLETIRAELRSEGWPEPVLAGSSGSGAMALYRVDLPPSESGLIEATLKALAARYDDDRVTVDTGVHNPARICRIPGTINAKSPTPQPDRPWSMATAKAVTNE